MEIVSYGPFPDQFGELRLPDEESEPVLVVLIHGGFWRDHYRLDLMRPLAVALERRSYPSWNIEYRRVGPSGGGWDTTTADVASAIDHVSAMGWTRLAVIGHSAGGHLALWNAGRKAPVEPELTVGLAPVADVIAANRNGTGRDATTNFFGGSVDEFPDRYAHAQPDRRAFAGRVVAIHGDADTNVPVEQSTALTATIDRVEILEAVDHFDVIDPSHSSWQLVIEELDAVADR